MPRIPLAEHTLHTIFSTPMLAAQRALVLYADSCSARAFSPGAPGRAASLDRIAEHGVTGWMAVRWPSKLLDDGEAGRRGVALAQVLGVMPDRLRDANGALSELRGFEQDSAHDTTLNERYGGLKIEILTNQPAVLGLVSSLRAACSLTTCTAALGTGVPNDQLIRDAGLSLSKEVTLALAGGTTDMLIVHLDCDALGDVGEGETRNGPGTSGDERGREARSDVCLRLLGAVADAVWKGGQNELLQVVIVGEASGGGLPRASCNSACDADVAGHGKGGDEVLLETLQGWAGRGEGRGSGMCELLETLRPPQSSEMHDGRVLTAEVRL